MPFRVSGKNIDVGEALRRRIGERIAETLGKFFDGGYSGHATISREGFGFRTECALHLDSGIILQADAMAADAYASADQAALRIERRLRRYKRRLKDRQASRPDDALDFAAPSYVIAAPQGDDAGEAGAVELEDHGAEESLARGETGFERVLAHDCGLRGVR